MKLIYFFLFLFVLLLSGYLYLNDFSFDNTSFSNYLINTLFVLILSSVGIVGGIMYLRSFKKRSSYYKDIMTIRQYYDYKGVR